MISGDVNSSPPIHLSDTRANYPGTRPSLPGAHRAFSHAGIPRG